MSHMKILSDIGIDNIRNIAKIYSKKLIGNDMISLFKKYGADIKYVFPSFWTNEDSPSLRVRNGKPILYISKAWSECTINYNLAHDFGHFILHSISGMLDDEYSLYGNSEYEREADVFARELLMPENVFISEYNKSSYPLSLSCVFNVPDYIVDGRIKELL